MDFEAELWGENLIDYLSRVYGEESQYVMIVVSHDYIRKQFTNHERQTAQARALQKKGETYILPIQFHPDARLPGMSSTVSYLNADLGARKLADIFVRKLESNASSLDSDNDVNETSGGLARNTYPESFPHLDAKTAEAFGLICAKMVSDGKLYLHSDIEENFIKDLIEATPDERAEIVEELVEEGYLSGERFLSGDRQWGVFAVTPFGYVQYARLFVPGFDDSERICIREIVDQSSVSAHRLAETKSLPLRDVRQILLYLRDMGLVKGDILSGDEICVYSPSSRLKKLARSTQ